MAPSGGLMPLADIDDLEKKVNALFVYFQSTSKLLDSVIRQNSELMLDLAEAQQRAALSEQ
jgi:hypothetical protein